MTPKIKLLCWSMLLHGTLLAQQSFSAIEEGKKDLYRFNLEKNFFASSTVLEGQLMVFKKMTNEIKQLSLKRDKKGTLVPLITKLNDAEYLFRKIDLYLFLCFAINTNDEQSSAKEDSLYGVMVELRNAVKQQLQLADRETIKSLLGDKESAPYRFFIERTVAEKKHLLPPPQREILRPFHYLQDNHFYDDCIKTIDFGTFRVGEIEYDVIANKGDWQNHADTAVIGAGFRKLLEGYGSRRNELGYGYIHLIRGLSAFSKTRNHLDIIEENTAKLFLKDERLNKMIEEIESNAGYFKKGEVNRNDSPTYRFNIADASSVISKATSMLGGEYQAEIDALLNPLNGRLDIAGGVNRLPMQGVASVYPVDVSVFFANQFEGYYIDLMLLSHEAGHAVQAVLMNKNNVKMLNGGGPGYFTESFGKFNELVVAHYLYENEKASAKRVFFKEEFKKRLLTLFGSTEEAAVEYKLVRGILNRQINNPDDLDSVTILTGNKYSDYAKKPWFKGLWMLLETNYKAPLHNLNDMLANLLAIHYFRQYLYNRKEFSRRYMAFLKNGYNAPPAELLKKFMNINVGDENFTKEALEFIKQETTK